MWTIQSERWKVDKELTVESSSGIWRAGEDCMVVFFHFVCGFVLFFNHVKKVHWKFLMPD